VRRTRKAEARKVRRGVESKGKTCLTFLPVQQVCVHGFPKLVVVVAQLPTLLILLDRFRASPQPQSRSQFLLFGLFGTKSRRMRATRKKEIPSPAGSKATTVVVVVLVEDATEKMTGTKRSVASRVFAPSSREDPPRAGIFFSRRTSTIATTPYIFYKRFYVS
jgi:hypothetical protein